MLQKDTACVCQNVCVGLSAGVRVLENDIHKEKMILRWRDSEGACADVCEEGEGLFMSMSMFMSVSVSVSVSRSVSVLR